MLEGARIRDQLSIEGIRERRVEREEQRTAGGQDPVEPRMLATLVSAHQCFLRQSESGQWNELGTFESKEASGVARNEPSHRREQPGVAVSRCERSRQVPGDFEKDLEAPGMNSRGAGSAKVFIASSRPSPIVVVLSRMNRLVIVPSRPEPIVVGIPGPRSSPASVAWLFV